MKKCQICKIEKDLEEFGNNSIKSDGKQFYCIICSRLKDKKCYISNLNRRKNIRENAKRNTNITKRWVKEYLFGKKCIDCDESHIACLA